MIKIVKGSYGLRVGKTVKPVTVGDAPIELEKEQEARLVRLGIAEYVDGTTGETAADKGVEGGKSSAHKGKAIKKGAEDEISDVEAPDDGEAPPELNAEDPVDDE